MEQALAAVLGRQQTADAKEANWYSKSLEYWNNVDVSVDGVLGGYGFIDENDIEDSRKVLTRVLPTIPPGAIAVDCGAGVGRISQNLLRQHFAFVDLVEPDQRYIAQAQAVLGDQVGAAHCCGLQDFQPPAGRYHCVWIQWVLNYLTDDDLLAMFRRLVPALVSGGRVIIKENTSKAKFILDREDTSITRPDSHFRKLFQQAGFEVESTRLAKNMPEGLFPIRIYVLRVAN
eukprot:c3554_g1_i1.p1 GENE.c3554_g1_i1~~c3554_g1_i1.p1  ORF type:complete len:247 (-),score=44.56 c3554_g1_i1:10-702(-)